MAYIDDQRNERAAAEAQYMAAYNEWKLAKDREAHGGPPAGPAPKYGGATNLVEPNSATNGVGSADNRTFSSQEEYDKGTPTQSGYHDGMVPDNRPLEPQGSPGATPPGTTTPPPNIKFDPHAVAPLAPTTVDTTQSDEIRRQQLEYLKALQDRAEGRAPSVAAAQMNLAQATIARNAQGLAAQARGNDAASARRAAIRSGADATGQAALNAALLRAQETTQAQGLQGQALSGVRGQDIGTATTNATLGADASKTNFLEGGVNNRFGANLGSTERLSDADRASREAMAGADRAARSNDIRYASDRQQGNTLLGGLLGGGAALGSAYLTSPAGQALLTSDERAKTAIKPDSDADVHDFLGALDEASYRYKDPADGAGERHGPMAQDLERSRIGRSTVRTGPDGVKRVDTGALTLALAGAVARMAKEKRRGA